MSNVTNTAYLHPGVLAYLRCRASTEGVSVHQLSWNKMWRVVWRSFNSTKQDLEFDTESEAVSAAKRVRYSDIGDPEREMAVGDFRLACEFWMDLEYYRQEKMRAYRNAMAATPTASPS